MPEHSFLQQTPQELGAQLETSYERGLDAQEAAARLERDGANQIENYKPSPWWLVFVRQFKSPLVLLLVAAALVAFVIGEAVDAAIVGFVVVFNALLGLYQEKKAERTFLSLSRLSTSTAIVIRDGVEAVVPHADLVVGDIVVLGQGDRVPADIRLVESDGMAVNESVLTGEALAVHKESDGVYDDRGKEECPFALWAGTYIEKGSGRGVVVATGARTRMGTIASEIAGSTREVPLQKRIRRLAHVLVGIGLAALVVLFVVGLLVGHDIRELTRIAVSLLVAVVPEGLPVVLTLVLSAGIYRMSRERVLVKRLEAVETLGHADIIATDKTGTITRNELVVSNLWTLGGAYTVSGVGYDPVGEIFPEETGNGLSAAAHELIKLAERSANARVVYQPDGPAKVIGDPTEAAMRVLGAKIGLDQDTLRTDTPFANDIPFDFKKKYYVSLFHKKDVPDYELVVTGAGEVVIDRATHILDTSGAEVPLGDGQRAKVAAAIARYSDDGLRVIGLAKKAHEGSEISHDDVDGLVFVGLLIMKDAIRASVPAALEKTRQAGLQVVMITGDHVTTATALAREAGIFRDGDAVMSGAEIESLEIPELAQKLANVTVFARVTPRHKMRIIEAYQHLGKTIAMTGDGVNDVPPLAAADLGMAMGITGTEAAKEAADIVLLEDDFGDVPHAVAEGRTIVLSMKRVIMFLLATNIAELLVIMIAVIVGFEIPLTPAQIIWLNVVTDSFLVIALGLQAASESVLHDPDYRAKATRFIGKPEIIRMAWMTSIMAIGTLGMFFLTQHLGGSYAAATTMALITMVLLQIFNAWGIAGRARGSLRDTKLFVTSLVSVTLLALLFFVPRLVEIFELALPDPMLLLVALGVGVVMLVGKAGNRVNRGGASS